MPSEDDPRVLAAAQEYLGELEAGRRPDRRGLLAKYPDVAGDLGPYLDALDAVHAAAPLLADPAAEPAAVPGEPLGDFRLVREIGRGGMGVVYEAVQLSLGRRVAVKVLPFAGALHGRQLQRFRTEAHAAAQLHHTNIVPVYAVGCERGVHFYAMQLIEGRPLDRVIAELRGDPLPAAGDTTADHRPATVAVAPPSAGTTTRAGRGRETYRTAARLAAQVADALDYAHEAGVVHRDVKPANLLVDDRGTVWVTDFGLAQVSSDVGLTQTGDIFGTLRYMSPEQAAGRRSALDHRTDVYSLGATLYELLTLRPIFPGEDRTAVLRQILHDEPTPLRAVDRGVPAELETIVLKAVAKAPEDRYATAGEMAADLRRFLDERPILARRPTLADRGRKWLRRHPAVVWSAVGVLFLGVVGLGVTAALVAREQANTKSALAAERERAREAEERFKLAKRSADEMIRIADEGLADRPGDQTLRRQLLAAALAFYGEFIDLRKDDPSAVEELEDTRTRVRRILADLAVMQGSFRHVLIRVPDVQDELRLSPAQRDEVRTALEDMRPLGPGPHRQPFDDRQVQKIVDEMRAHDAAITAILAPDQRRRLDQIALQSRGADAFRDPEVAAAVGLTAAQKTVLRGLDFGPPGDRGPPGDHGPPRGRGRGPGPGPNPQDGIAPLLATFTPDQLAAWKRLAGEPFAGRLPRFFRGPGRPPGPPDVFAPRPGDDR
jgi:serine/threonine protein kinase